MVECPFMLLMLDTLDSDSRPTDSGELPHVVELGLSLSFCAFFASLFTAHWISGTTPVKEPGINKNSTSHLVNIPELNPFHSLPLNSNTDPIF